MNYYLLEKEQVFNELKNNIYKNLHELETISNSYNLKFFRLNNNIIITSKLREDYYHIMIILNNYDDEFPYNLSQFAKDQYIQKYILSVNYENELNVNHFNFLKFIYACNSYVKLKQRDNIFINCIKELTEDDKAIVDLCNFQEIKNRPSFSFLYETFVINKEGRIFAYIKDSKIIGYLSCLKSYSNIWDLDYIFVSDQFREKGIGTALAITYSNTILKEKNIPYWSNALNKASCKTAVNAGFSLCCNHWYFEMK